MPVSSEIKSIEVTKCNTLIALVLKNNNIVVFDLNTGEFSLKIKFQICSFKLKTNIL